WGDGTTGRRDDGVAEDVRGTAGTPETPHDRHTFPAFPDCPSERRRWGMSTWTDKVAVVTGASSGIGWALAEELARVGCRLGLVARRQDLLDQLAAAVRTRGGTVEVAVADVADRDRLLAAVGALKDRLGPVDLLVA